MEIDSLAFEPIYVEAIRTSLQERQSYSNKKSRYGITKDQFLEIAERQGMACAMCREDVSEAPYSLGVDHDHETNEIRGLLCSNCNWALGALDDNIHTLQRAIEYLQSPGSGIFSTLKKR